MGPRRSAGRAYTEREPVTDVCVLVFNLFFTLNMLDISIRKYWRGLLHGNEGTFSAWAADVYSLARMQRSVQE